MARATPLLLLVLVALAPAAPGEQDLVVRAPERPLLLGERFDVVLSGPAEVLDRVQLTDLPDGLDVGEPSLRVTEAGTSLVLPLRAVRQGNLSLTMHVAEDDGARALPPVELEVVLPLEPGRVPRVAEPLAPVTVPMTAASLWPFVLTLVLGLGLFGVAVVAAGRVIVIPEPPPLPADRIATDSLARLRSHLPRTFDEVPAFVVAVSGILRTYVEERYAVRAPESTTEEFLGELADRHDALGEHRPGLARFLELCDLVKFAKHRPEPTGIVHLLDEAEAFVEGTRA